MAMTVPSSGSLPHHCDNNNRILERGNNTITMAFKPPRLSTYRKPSTVPVPTNSTPFLTISAKFFKIGGLFIVKRCLTSEDMHISVVLFWMYLFATIAVFIINRPWRANVARGVSSKQWMRIGYISVLDLLSLGFLFFSVSNLSTIRTVMFTEYSEIWAPLLFASTVVDRSNLGGLRSTGSKMVLGTFFAALFLDLINLPSDIGTVLL
ncbi:hypothetical protein BKA69DRAFT_222457 [Paraphysoderma sedebokerense]|nr:hypothetical protein BKA69DRAFT_222457 [Paraphysoderma sedebokerense]